MTRFASLLSIGLPSIGAAFALLATPAHAADLFGEDVDVSLGVDYVTEYVFRGLSLADDAIQPYVELGFGDLTVGAWASTGIGENSELAGDEIDLYASYGVQLADGISGSVGVTYYHYPQGGSLFGTDEGATGSYEFSAGAGLDDVVLAPAVTAFYDLTLETFTLEGSLGHSVETGGNKGAFDLGLVAGLVDGDGTSYEYATATLGYAYPLTDAAALSVSANYSLSSGEDTLGFSGTDIPNGGRTSFTDQDDLLWFGVGLSTGF